ncbi:MAG: hypothetical protein ACRBF0_07475 [Calditrichia bacterium]
MKLLLLLFCSTLVFAQTPQKPCSDARASQFDFWIGEWELSWAGGQAGTPEGQTGSARNHITKNLGGCTIEENFSFADSSFIGRSWSVFNAQTEHWQQTWVDNSGAYLLFTGGYEDGKMELRSAVKERNGKQVVSRMIFENITADAFDWNWQRSLDGGQTWSDLWNIRYRRKK